MNQSESLYKLIHSLNTGERRAITLAIKTHRYAKAYLKMFKEMSLQQKYDEQKLKERMKNEPFIGHFAVIKNQLFQFILKVLRSFHEGSSLDFKLKELTLDAAVLSKKALYAESWHKLQKITELALEFEDWKVLLETLYKQFLLMDMVKPKDQHEDEFLRLKTHLINYLSFLNNYESMAVHLLTLLSMIKKYKNGKAISESPEAARLISEPLLQDETRVTTLRAKMIYFYIWSHYLIHTCQYGEARPYLLKQIDLFEHNPNFIDWIPGNYTLAMRDLVLCYYLQQDFDTVLKTITGLKKLLSERRIRKLQGQRFNILIFSWTFRYEVICIVHYRSNDGIRNQLKIQESFFQKNVSFMEPVVVIETLLALAVYYNVMRDNSRSVKLIEKLLSQPASGKYHACSLSAMTMQLIIHYEEKEVEIAEYILNGIMLFAKKIRQLSETEKLLISLCENLIMILSRKKSKLTLTGYLRSFSLLKENRYEIMHYRFFDITVWLKEKCKGKQQY